MSAHTRRLMGSLGLMLQSDWSSIPSTAAGYTPVPRETEDQRRERLAVEAGHTLTTCPGCLQPRHTMRVGYDLSRVNCDCHLTEEQRRRAAQELAQRRDREQRKREWDQAARQQQREIAQDRRDAAACLRDRGGNCHEARPPRAPFPMCASCAINTQAPTRNPRHSSQDGRWQRFGT